MAAGKIKISEPIYVLITRGSETLYERKFFETPILIGRGLDCDICLPQVSNLSLQHFQLASVDGGWIAVDLNSGSGIGIGSERFSQVYLTPQQKIEVADVNVYIEYKSTKTPSIPRPPGTLIDRSKLQREVDPYPTLPKAVYPPVQPIQLRSRQKFLLSETWFKREQKSNSLAPFSSGIENLKIFQNPAREKFPPKVRSLEAYVIWRGQVLESRIYQAGEVISIGREADDLYVPTIAPSMVIGRCENHKFDVYLQKNSQGNLFRNGQSTSLSHLISSGQLAVRNKCFLLTGQTLDHCQIQIGNEIEVHLKFGAAPRQLARTMMRTPDKMLKRALAYSGSAHFAFLLLAFLLMPVMEAPKIKHLPPRIAKLLVQKPKPMEPPVAPPPPPMAKEEPKSIPETRPVTLKKKLQPPPKRVVIKTNEKIKVVRKNVVTEPNQPKKDVTQMGALAALGALGGPPSKSNQPVAININKNAGGQTGISANQVIGALRAQGGRLQAGGMAGVKTNGKGYGSGSEYGVQGIKGLAGSRGIAGGVVGSPKLMNLERTEGLTREQVMSVVKRHLSRIQQCYERSLLATPDLSGRVEYEWHIQARGQVEWVKIKQSDLAAADTLNHCVMAIFQAMRFPIAKNGEATTPSIGFPFGRL